MTAQKGGSGIKEEGKERHSTIARVPSFNYEEKEETRSPCIPPGIPRLFRP